MDTCSNSCISIGSTCSAHQSMHGATIIGRTCSAHQSMHGATIIVRTCLAHQSMHGSTIIVRTCLAYQSMHGSTIIGMYMLGASKYARSNHYWMYMTYMLGVSKYARSIKVCTVQPLFACASMLLTASKCLSKHAPGRHFWQVKEPKMLGATIIG